MNKNNNKNNKSIKRKSLKKSFKKVSSPRLRNKKIVGGDNRDDKKEFCALLLYLKKYGTFASKLTFTDIEHPMNDIYSLLYFYDVLNYSCTLAGPFLTALFTEEYKFSETVDSTDILNRFPSYKSFKGSTFEDLLKFMVPMTFIRFFPLDHDCSLIYISDDEIYLADFYMEPERKNVFNVKKFKSADEAKSCLHDAFYSIEKGPQAYKNLFGFTNDSYLDSFYTVSGIPEQQSVVFYPFKIKKLPTFEKLKSLWAISRQFFINRYIHDWELVDKNIEKMMTRRQLNLQEEEKRSKLKYTNKPVEQLTLQERKNNKLLDNLYLPENVGFGYINIFLDNDTNQDLDKSFLKLNEKYNFSLEEFILKYDIYVIMATQDFQSFLQLDNPCELLNNE